MNKLNDIFKKVAELEKNAQEVKLGMQVELAYIDNLNKALAEGQKNESSYYSDFKTTLNGVIQKAREIEVKYNVLASNINEPIFQMEKQAKELGLDIRSTDYYKKSQSILKSIDIRKQVIDDIINNIQKFGF